MNYSIKAPCLKEFWHTGNISCSEISNSPNFCAVFCDGFSLRAQMGPQKTSALMQLVKNLSLLLDKIIGR